MRYHLVDETAAGIVVPRAGEALLHPQQFGRAAPLNLSTARKVELTSLDAGGICRTRGLFRDGGACRTMALFLCVVDEYGTHFVK